MSFPRVLVIAGSDSSGGAGLEADQRVLAVHGCYAMTATTALTAQNTLGVDDIHITPPKFVRKQIDACLSDISCQVVKMGMLASADTILEVVGALQSHKVLTLVVDPVMVATSGAVLLPDKAIQNLREKLLPMTTLLTPNLPEAQLLVKDSGNDVADPTNLDDLKALAKRVQQLGPKAVLLKGGHMALDHSYRKSTSDNDRKLTVDILYDGDEYTVIESSWQTSKNTHGTGCSLASSIAANLAISLSTTSSPKLPSTTLQAAVRKSIRYVSAGISSADPTLGHGSGPINHFHTLQTLPFSKGYFIEYLLSHPKITRSWHNYTFHDFPQQMALGTLDIDEFKAYMIQDYLYLTHFARSNALAAYKSSNMSQITASAEIVLHIEREMSLHLEYCRSFGLTKSEIESHRESLACVAYSRYVLDIGQSQDLLGLQMALLPCLLGYGETATRLYNDSKSHRDLQKNLYWKWIENYVAEDYREAVQKGRALIEEQIVKQSPQRIEELVEIFVRATDMEVLFWGKGAHQVAEVSNGG